MSLLTLKLTRQGENRVRRVPRDLSFDTLRAFAADCFGVTDFKLSYVDEEGDKITMSSDACVREAVQHVEKLRVLVESPDGAPMPASSSSQAPDPAAASAPEMEASAAPAAPDTTTNNWPFNRTVELDVDLNNLNALPAVFTQIAGAIGSALENAGTELSGDLANLAANLQQLNARCPMRVPHPGVSCDECDAALCGPRYKCATCAVSYDLCSQCYSRNRDGGLHAHPFVVIERPGDTPKRMRRDEPASDADGGGAPPSSSSSSSSSAAGVRHSAYCDVCQQTIFGVRWKCSVCADYDHCSKCEAKNESGELHPLAHPMLKIVQPQPHPHCAHKRQAPFWPHEHARRFHGGGAGGWRAPVEDCNARFVRDVTLPDNTPVASGDSLTKIWLLRSHGATPIPAGSRLQFASGDQLGDTQSAALENDVPPGEEFAVEVDLVAPKEAGRYTAYYRMATPTGKRFGHRVWVTIDVFAAAAEKAKEFVVTAAPAPVPTAPTADVAPPAPAPAAADVPFAKERKQLESMGFGEDAFHVLEEKDGDVLATVTELLSSARLE